MVNRLNIWTQMLDRDILCERVNQASPRLPDGRRLNEALAAVCAQVTAAQSHLHDGRQLQVRAAGSGSDMQRSGPSLKRVVCPSLPYPSRSAHCQSRKAETRHCILGHQ